MGGAGRGWEGNSGCVRPLLGMKEVSGLIPGIFVQKNQAGVDGKGLGLRPQGSCCQAELTILAIIDHTQPNLQRVPGSVLSISV